jgi:parallel beta-helix repeat protein
MKKLLFIAFMGCLCSSSYGSAYYVSDLGQNDWPGTETQPWKTLQFAAGQVDPGDSVIVTAGVYTGFYLDRSGTAGNPIVFHALSGAEIDRPNNTTDDGINLEGADYIVIEGFTITNDNELITRAGIRSVINTGAIIRNNTIENMGTWGIFTGFSENILIEGNSCSGSKIEHGIYHSNSADNPVIRGNLLFDNHANGIHMNGDISAGGDGIISNALVEQNIIFNNGTAGGSGINCDGVQQSVIRNNLLYGNHAGGITLYQTDAADGAKNNLIINNTVYMADDGRWAVNINSGSTGNQVYNNILFTEHTYRGALAVTLNSLADFESDHNLLIGKFTTDDGNSVMDLESWQQETGQDMNSIVSVPGETFADILLHNYRLLEGCDAIDNGTPEEAPAVDLGGAPRPAGEGFDIGAWEYGAVPPLAIDATGELIRVNVFPNPSAGSVTVSCNENIDEAVLLNLNGAVLEHFTPSASGSFTFRNGNSLTGLYYIRVISGNRQAMLPVYFTPR